MGQVYHITTADQWRRAQVTGVYRTASLDTEGFVHCSTRDQVVRVANQRFAGWTGLVLLAVDPSRVNSPVVFENTEGGSELFPHVYGPIGADAVDAVAVLKPGPDGRFAFPFAAA